ncbi:MAG TPA: adenosylcobalamin-dependent ribonucleoside-diphosphate reductase [Deltaproteobacteria bacterium]|nr:adenosylcobalamin-dependent ribonucleoside-diphosphate reductase [Deltaproteobacteria bacterium]
MKALSPLAKKILEARYLRRDSLARVMESPKDLFRRVAHVVAQAEAAFSSLDEVDYYENEYYQMMSQLEFLPNSPTLMNAGKEKGQLAACFVLPVPDSIEGITKAVQQMSILHKTGAGTGFSFSSIRPKNDPVSSTGGLASGPVSFLKLFDTATDAVKLGRQRRGANMGVLRVDHPDVLDFIHAKETGGLSNFNLSVGVTSHFMRCLKKGTTYPLLNPHNGKIVRFVPAREIFEAICKSAWASGDPGLLFLDEINRHNPTPQIGAIEATNPCGEQPLLPYECCNLGSINLAALAENGEFDEERFEILIDLAVRFLDNVIDVNHYPLPEIQKITLANRKIGLGVMGFAEMLMKLDIPYDSAKARSFATTMMKLFLKRCRQTSAALAKQRGAFANYKGSTLEKLRIAPQRNATLITIAPSGTLSLLAGTTGGIEPAFAVSYYRKILGGEEFLETLPVFETKLRAEGAAHAELFEKIAQTGSVQSLPGVPKKLQEIFKCATDLKPLEHVRMQAVFQKYTDNAVSKTVNLPPQATWEDVYQIYMAAYELKCKGITIYRDSSQPEQVVTVGKAVKRKKSSRAVLSPVEDENCDLCITYQ